MAISKSWENSNEYEDMCEIRFNKNLGLKTSISKSGDFDNRDHNQNFFSTEPFKGLKPLKG